MARVPGKMYRNITQHAYTRREYMGGVPGLRILQFHSGNKTGTFPVELHLVAEERGQLRHTALEAMRITAVRYMDKKAGRDNYHLTVRVYPHNVLRQNKQASGAGADRVSMGMRLAFGKPIGTAARIAAGQEVMTIRTVARGIPFAKDALRKAGNKIATPFHINIISKDERSVEQMMNEAMARGGRALAGAGAEEDTEPEVEEVEEEEVDVEALEGDEDEDAQGEDDRAETGREHGKRRHSDESS